MEKKMRNTRIIIKNLFTRTGQRSAFCPDYGGDLGFEK